MGDVVWTNEPVNDTAAGFAVFFALTDPLIVWKTPTAFLMQSGDSSVVFLGTFTVSGNVITAGTITGMAAFYGSPPVHVVTATGYALDAAVFQQAVTAGDGFALVKLVFGQPMTVNGADQLFPEIIQGGFATDHIYGNGGEDWIQDWGGDDFVYGGAGDDVIAAEAEIIGIPAGNDLLYGDAGDDEINGGGGNDFISGGDGKDTIRGGEGSDTADYSEKADSISVALNGAADAEVTVGSAVEDTISDIENVNGGLGNDAITGDASVNRLVGNDGDDRLAGMDGNDLLSGSGGRDRIDGGLGNDQVDGGDGNDILKGGKDSDTFVFNTALKSNNVDKIKDFARVADTISLADEIFVGLDIGALQRKLFHIGAKAHDGNDRIIYDKENGKLFYDADGKGGAKQMLFAKLDDGVKMAADDFLIV